MNTESDSVYVTLFPKLGTLVPEFGLKLTGDHWEATTGTTPCCRSAAAGHLYIYSGSCFGLKCHRCEAFTHFQKLPGGVNALLEAAGLSQQTAEPELEERLRRHRQLERILKACSTVLKSGNPGLPAIACKYLQERGMSLEYVFTLGYGVLSDLNTLKASGITEADLTEAGFTGLMMSRIVAPYHDADGFIIGVWGRVIPGTGFSEDKKYLYTSGLRRDCPYQLHAIDPSLPVIVVDGVLSADILRSHGIPNVVAAGAQGLTKQQVEHLKAKGVTAVVLFLDYDPVSHAGEQGTVKSIKLLTAAGIRTYAVPHWEIMDRDHPNQKVDPDSHLLAHSVESTQKLILNALHSTRYLVQRQMQGQNPASDLTRDTVLEHAGDILADTSTDGVEAADVIKDLAAWTGLSKDIVAQRLLDARTKCLERRHREQTAKLLDRASQCARLGDLEQARSIVTQVTASSGAPGMRLPYFDDNAFLEAVSRKPDYVLKTGWGKLDGKVSLRSGELGILSARPGHGKTAAACNILDNVLESEPTRTALFLTYEIPQPFQIARLASIRAHRISHTRLSPMEDIVKRYGQRLANDDSALPPTAMEAIRFFGKCGRDGRLISIYEPSWNVRQIYDLVAATKQDGRDISVVVVDYVEMVPPLDGSLSREQQIGQTVHELRVMSNVLGVPVLLLSQQNRDNAGKPSLQGLRYSGQLEQEASVVIGLWNEARQEGEQPDDGENKGNEEITLLEAHILKNRYGVFGIVPLQFDMLTGLIAENLTPYQFGRAKDTGK